LKTAAAIENVHKQTVEKVIQRISNNLDENISLEEMANMVYLSPFHFNRVFRRVTGIPPKEFLCALRIEKSKELLENTNLRILDICLNVGYSSMGTFTTRFRKAVGVSPREFRRGKVLEYIAEQSDGLKLKGIKGEIIINSSFKGEIYIGVFEGGLPSGVPISCQTLHQQGSYYVPINKNGEFTLFAVAITSPKDASGESGKVVYQGMYGQFSIDDKKHLISQNIKMRPPNVTDPPILVALPTYKQSESVRTTNK
jgi:AraC family transcriptional regulator